jgi:hypothetical protein
MLRAWAGRANSYLWAACFLLFGKMMLSWTPSWWQHAEPVRDMRSGKKGKKSSYWAVA